MIGVSSKILKASECERQVVWKPVWSYLTDKCFVKTQGCFRKRIWLTHALTKIRFEAFIFQRKTPKITFKPSYMISKLSEWLWHVFWNV